MVFGFFKKNKGRIEDLERAVKHLEKSILEYRKDMESFSGDMAMRIEALGNQVKNIEGVKEYKEPNPEIKIYTTKAILNVLENKENPLDFNYIFDNIKKYDLKQKNPSPAAVKRSIYNLVYNGKVVCGKKRGTYQICATPTKH